MLKLLTSFWKSSESSFKLSTFEVWPFFLQFWIHCHVQIWFLNRLLSSLLLFLDCIRSHIRFLVCLHCTFFLFFRRFHDKSLRFFEGKIVFNMLKHSSFNRLIWSLNCCLVKLFFNSIESFYFLESISWSTWIDSSDTPLYHISKLNQRSAIW